MGSGDLLLAQDLFLERSLEDADSRSEIRLLVGRPKPDRGGGFHCDFQVVGLFDDKVHRVQGRDGLHALQLALAALADLLYRTPAWKRGALLWPLSPPGAHDLGLVPTSFDDLDKPPTLDWIHLPFHVEPRSLWASLHDGDVRALRSDPLARTAEIEVDIHDDGSPLALPPEVTILLQFRAVTSLRSQTWRPYPAPPVTAPNASEEERQRDTAVHQAKARVESLRWEEAEKAIGREGLWISDASLIEKPDEVALHLSGNLQQSNRWLEMFLHAEGLEIARSDGARLDVAQLIALGEAYWSAYNARPAAPEEP